MWKEVEAAYFKVLSQSIPERSEENNKETQPENWSPS
jgi:hypothetical protein